MPASANDNRVPQLRMIHDEIERKFDDAATRRGSMDSRASVLVAASGLAATLVGASAPDGWLLCAIGCALGSAALGILALFPRTGRSIVVERIRDDIYPLSEGDALAWLINAKVPLIAPFEKGIQRKGRLLRAGFVTFGGAVLFTFVSVTPLQVKI